MTSDQRRDPRFETDLAIQLHSGERDLDGNLKNVSASGAAIEFAANLGKPQIAFEIGDSVDLRADVGEPTSGVVVRCDPTGIAIKFDKPEDELLAELVGVVQRFMERK